MGRCNQLPEAVLKRIVTLSVLTVLLACLPAATALCGEHEDHDHNYHSHDVSGYELGLSAGLVHLEEEDENAASLHMHFGKRLGDEGFREHLSLGLGGEVIFAEHQHFAGMLQLSVLPWKGLVLSAAPGILWAEHEGQHEDEGEHEGGEESEWETDYTTHLEAAYVLEFGEYDVGPVVGYSWTAEETHFMVGVHFGMHF